MSKIVVHMFSVNSKITISKQQHSNHGHGTARRDRPTGENAKTGRSLNLTLFELLYLQTVFALGRALKQVAGPEVWAVWRDFYMRTRKYPREGPSTRPDPCF